MYLPGIKTKKRPSMNKKFQPLNNYLQNSVKFATIRAKLQQNQGLLQQIQRLLPAQLNEHCVGLVEKPSQLILYADSSAWASRLRYFTRELQTKLNNKQLYFNKISVKIAIDNRRVIKKSSGRKARLLSARNSDQLQKVADHTHDQDLRAALMRLSLHNQDRK